jgi:hypothetical protein
MRPNISECCALLACFSSCPFPRHSVGRAFKWYISIPSKDHCLCFQYIYLL